MHSRPAKILLAVLFLALPAQRAFASSRQFNTFTEAAGQPSPVNPAIQATEECASCQPPKHAKPVLDHGCPTCPKLRAQPPMLQSDCEGCGNGKGKFTTAPFSTVTDTCADCESFEQHPRLGWCIDCDQQGTGVDLNNGDLFHRATDFEIPGRGFSFRFARRHVSGITYDGPLGKQWDFTYNARLDEDGTTGDVTLWDGTGRGDLFTEASGVYTTPTGRFEALTLASGSPDQFILAKPNGTEYAFEEDGSTGNWQLATITDRAGNLMDFSYDVNKRLETISDTLGRDIDFTYDGNDRITKVTDFASREWVYAYTSGELTAVTSPA